MNRVFAMFALAAVIFVGCGLFDPGEGDPLPPGGTYPLDLSHPDSLMQQLTVSYERQQIDEYATLLSKEFTFYFTPGSPEALEEPDGLTFTADSLRTYNIFQASEVTDIKLQMTWKDPVPALWQNEFETLRLDLDQLALDVETNINDTTYRVENQLNSFYFKLGESEKGEDPERYYLIGWEDYGVVGSAPKNQPLSVAVDEEGNRIVYTTLSHLFGNKSPF